MKCLILAAGYATRLYPLTKDIPKPLLEVAGKSILERLMVLAGDDLFDFDLCDFEKFLISKGADVITAHEITDINLLSRIGVIELDPTAKVLSFEEKHKSQSQLGVFLLYTIYKKETLPFIKQYLAEGNNPDTPGNSVPLIIKHKPVYAYQFSGQWHDIGTIESYEEAQLVFA